MSAIIDTAAAGMQAAHANILNRTNNLANLGSTAYQAIQVETKDTFYVQLSKAVPPGNSIEKPGGIYLGTGVKVTGTYRDLSQGTIKQTQDPLNIAIIGSGYFAVTMENNVRGYTRAGSFKRDSQGNIVTSEGYPLADNIQIPLTVKTESIHIDSQGVLTATDTASSTPFTAQINIYGFANEQALDPQGKGYFTENLASGTGNVVSLGVQGFAFLQQKSLELSNVSTATEFAEFMEAQRTYEMCARMMRADDEMNKELMKA